MLLLCALALAASSLALPKGEDPAGWASALGLGDFTLGGADARVTLLDLGNHWEIRVTDGQGGVRTATVAPPRSPRDREDVVLLASSLLRPLTPRDPWRVTPPPPPPVVPPLPPLDLRGLQAPQQAIVLPMPVPSPLETSLPSRRPPPRLQIQWEDSPFLELQQRVILHAGFRPALGLGLGGGYRPLPWLLVSGSFSWNAATPLLTRPTLSRESYGITGEVWWMAPRLRVGLKASGTLEHYAYESEDQGRLFYEVPLGAAGVEVGYWIPLLSGAGVVPQLGGMVELSQGTVEVGGVTLERLLPLVATASFTVHLGLHPIITPDRSSDLSAP